MSDIGLDLSSVIALLVFMISAAVYGFAGLVSLILAIVLAKENGVRESKAFGFFIAAIPFTIIDLIGFVVMFETADSNTHDVNDLLDKAACGWFLLQPPIWIAAAIFFNRFRRK